MRQVAKPSYLYEIIGDGELARRDEVRTQRRLRQLLRKRKDGVTYIVLAMNGDEVVDRIRVRGHRKLPEPADITGTRQIKQWGGIVKAFWPRARFAGSTVCKWDSDHAFGAALDHFDTWENMEASHALAINSAEELGVRYSILGNDIWLAGPPHTTGSRGHHSYTGTYHHHHHVSVRDKVCGVYCSPGPGACG